MAAAAMFWLHFFTNRRSIQSSFEISGIVVGKGGRRVRGDYYLTAPDTNNSQSRGICTPEDRLDRFSRSAQATNWIEVTKKNLVCQNEFIFLRFFES